MRSELKAEANLVKLSAGVDTESLGVKGELKILNAEASVKVNDTKVGVDMTAVSVKATAGADGNNYKVKLAQGKVGNLSGDVKIAAKTDAKLELGVGLGPVKVKAGINLTEGKKAFTKLSDAASTYIKGKINEITKYIPKF